MKIRITCHQCAYQFAIEPDAAMREIDRLKSDNADLRAKLAAKETTDKNNPFGDLWKVFGL